MISEADVASDPMVLVEWLDSRGVHQAWTDIEDIEGMKFCFNLSVGFMVYQDEDRIVLCPHIADAEEKDREGCGSMAIPRWTVQRIVELERGRVLYKHSEVDDGE